MSFEELEELVVELAILVEALSADLHQLGAKVLGNEGQP